MTAIMKHQLPCGPKDPSFNTELELQLWNLCKLCWHANPKERPTINVVQDRLQTLQTLLTGGSLPIGDPVRMQHRSTQSIQPEDETERVRDHREVFRNKPQDFSGGWNGRQGGGLFDRGGSTGRRGRGGPGFLERPRDFKTGGHGGNQHLLHLNTSNNANNVHRPQVQSPLVQIQALPLYQGSSPYATSPDASFNSAPPPPQTPVSLPPLHPPVTQLSSPLDPTSHNLLGQLEFYFSANNLPQDHFLRQKVGHIALYLVIMLTFSS